MNQTPHLTKIPEHLADGPDPIPEYLMLGLFRKTYTVHGRIRLRPVWRRIGILFFALTVFGWFGKSFAFYAFFKYYREFERVEMVEMLAYPFNATQVREKFGDYHIAKAQQFLKEGKYQQASYFARIGLVRSPSNLDGRLIVAQFESFSRPDTTVKLLEEGLAYAGRDLDYVRNFLRTLLQYKEDLRIEQFARRELPATPQISSYYQIIAHAWAYSLFYRGNLDGAEDLIKAYQLDSKIDGISLLAQIYWSRGLQDTAIQRLEAFTMRAPGQVMEPVYKLLSSLLREKGDGRGALRYAVLRATYDPFAAEPRVEILYYYHKNGEVEKERKEADAILQQFRNDEKSIIHLANFATDTGNTELARRIYELALENSFNIASFGLLYIEAHVVAKDYRGAIAFCNDLSKENPYWMTQYEFAFNSLRSLAYFGAGSKDLGQLYLDKFTQARGVPVATLISAARRYSALGFPDQARAILENAYRIDAKSQVALSGIIGIDLDQGNSRDLAEMLRRLLQLRRPSYDLIRRAYRELTSDRFIFTGNRQELLIDLSGVLREIEPVKPS